MLDRLQKDSIFAPATKKDLIAQLVEHLPFKERVLGSSPSQITSFFGYFQNCSSPLNFKRFQGPGAGIGRQARLRALCPFLGVRVRLPLWALYKPKVYLFLPRFYRPKWVIALLIAPDRAKL